MQLLQVITHIHDEITRTDNIPATYWETLDERILIFGKSHGRLPRNEEPRKKQEYMSHFRLKNAQKVYVSVLERAPHYFIPFLLATSPRACQSIKLDNIIDCLNKPSRLPLNKNIQSIIEKAARKAAIFDSSNFQRLIQLLFAQGACLYW
jgi:hypothetical protein